jgi:hypothetical protein
MPRRTSESAQPVPDLRPADAEALQDLRRVHAVAAPGTTKPRVQERQAP